MDEAEHICQVATAGKELLRMHLLHTPLNKGQKEGRPFLSERLLVAWLLSQRASVATSRASSASVAKTCSPRRSEISLHTLMPRALLPCASRSGEKTPMPPLPGTTTRIPPLTPLLAGTPMSNAH